MEKSRCGFVIGCKELHKKRSGNLTDSGTKKRTETWGRKEQQRAVKDRPGGLLFAEKQLQQRV